jgi:patatin-related protein
MNESVSTAVSPATEEVRLALTMTGGVSLAVWMGGVAREIDLVMQASKARRARQMSTADPVPGPPNTLHANESAQRELYAKLLELLDVVVEVDVLSGTSAGGINAVLLAYARARNGDLGPLRDLWLDMGALLDLLRNPKDSDVPSLLYGDRWMLKALNEALPKLAPVAQHPKPPSTTLYVTTTLLTGESSRFTDDIGTLVQDSNQRGLFTFTEEHLAEDGIEGALALAARSTASFPGAFEPSFIPFGTTTPQNGEIPRRPDMSRYANITRSHWVADGGLLDNQPLDVLLERIFDRRARRPVRRVLLYVVPTAGPSPDLIAATPGDQLTKPYRLLDGLCRDLSAATSQSISTDLRAIVTHNDRVTARADLRLQLASMANRLPASERLLTPSLRSEYQRREGERQARKVVTKMMQLLSTWPPQAAPNSVGIPPEWQPALKPGGDAEQACRRAVTARLTDRWSRRMDANGAALPDALPADSEAFAEFGQSTFDNGKSIALTVLRLAYEAATTTPGREDITGLVEELHAVADQPDRPSAAGLVEKICQDSAQQVLADGTHRSLVDTAKVLADTWADENGVDPRAWTKLAGVLHSAAGRLASISQRGEDALSTYVEYLGLDVPETDEAALATRLFDLAVAEQALLPVDAGVYQPVELVQISADTRSLLTPSVSTAAGKLTGLQFHHFGAFYKQSWRANDWMWGRLDAAGWLVHVLLDPRRLRQVAADRPVGSRVTWLLDKLTELHPAPLPAGSSGNDRTPTRASLRQELAFLDDPTADPPPSLPRTSLWVATAWQHLITADELPKLAKTISGEANAAPPDRSPADTRNWARKVLEPGADLDALLDTCPVPRETFATDMGTPLMVHTIAKAAATTTAAVSSVQQIPGPVRPAVTTAHTIALGGYRVTSSTKALPRYLIIIGLAALALGIGAATQSATIFGITGLIIAGVGGYLVTFGTWQISGRLLAALVAITLTGAVGALATPSVRRGLFGTSEDDPGYVGHHVHWLATAWWHPLLAVSVVALVITLVDAAFSRARAHR